MDDYGMSDSDRGTSSGTTTVGVVGDMMFGDQIATYGYGFDSTHAATALRSTFAEVGDQLGRFDVVVGNFEGVVDEAARGSASPLIGTLCTGPEAARRMHDANIRVASLANNHTMDHGPEQYLSTAATLEKAGVAVVGHRERPWHVVDGGRTDVAVIAASYVPETSTDPLYWYRPTADDWAAMLNALRAETPGCRVLAYLHWGNEFVRRPNPEQLEICRMLTELGVDAIVGCHSHTVQTAALVDGVPVHFGLGNFVSDYWQDRLRDTVVAEIRFDGTATLAQTVRCRLDDRGCPRPVAAESMQLAPFDGRTCSRSDVAGARLRARIEYAAKLLRGFHRIRGKAIMARWALGRVGYLARYGVAELRRPGLVYEKYSSPTAEG